MPALSGTEPASRGRAGSGRRVASDDDQGARAAGRGQGRHQLTIGEPNFASPPHAIEAAHQAALHGETKYPPQDGIPALKQAIQRKFKRDCGLDFALDEICVTNGGKQAIFNASWRTVDQGDEVVDPAPSWIAYALMTQLFGGEPVFVHLPAEQRLQAARRGHRRRDHAEDQVADAEQPEQPLRARAARREELPAIADVMRKHPHVWIMSDDMYEHLVFDGFTARDDRAGRAGPARPHPDHHRRVEDLRDDRLAHRLCRRPEGPDQGDGQHAGPGHRRRLRRRPGRGCPRRWTARRTACGEQIAAYAAPPRHGGGDAERLQGHQLPQARRRVLCVSQRRRLHRPDHCGRPQAGDRSATSASRCWRKHTSPPCTAPPTA